MSIPQRKLITGAMLIGLSLSLPVFALSPVTVTDAKSDQLFKKPGYSPYAGRNFPTNVYWGDQHIHTGWSADAGASGTRLTPEDSVRFARGEEVLSATGQPAKLARPLDWVAITDHSDAMGVIDGIVSGDSEMMQDPILKKWNKQINAGGAEAGAAMSEMIGLQSTGKLPAIMMDPAFMKTVWERNTEIMEQYNEPGRFTTFIAYEWSSNPEGGNNIHRNVIYRDNKDKADRVLPMTTFDSINPEDLWAWMQNWEDKTGGSLLAIPHNGNLSNGMMFALTDFKGNPITKEWAETRARWEPLFEVTQGKGTSEAHPSLSPNDEFADFEIWERGNLNLVPKEPGDLKTEYARDALKNGLAFEQQLGANPYKIGLVGGTDTHTGLTMPEENNFFGKYGTSEPSPERWDEDALSFDGRVVKGWELSASGWTGVWAAENTRASIWDAMKRKETYGTTGPRMWVRFFGGFDFVETDAFSREPAVAGYSKGVPMGGDLSASANGESPSFLVAAMKDPMSGNLDRIQIIKGWSDADGKTHEKIYNVAWGDADIRQANAEGQLPPVGNTVNAETASWRNTIGDPELITVWQDPDFDPTVRAFYYARVLEIPTPRWTTFDALKFGVTLSDEVPISIQERAYTSPIWYTP